MSREGSASCTTSTVRVHSVSEPGGESDDVGAADRSEDARRRRGGGAGSRRPGRPLPVAHGTDGARAATASAKLPTAAAPTSGAAAAANATAAAATRSVSRFKQDIF